MRSVFNPAARNDFSVLHGSEVGDTCLGSDDSSMSKLSIRGGVVESP